MLKLVRTQDWRTLRAEGLCTVLDPLTFRVAESFLTGAPAEGDEPLWSAISGNVGALAAFVDAIMIHDRLPVFDYGVSWEPNLAGFATPLVDLCNSAEEVLVEVSVEAGAYEAARRPAIRVLQELPPVEPRLAAAIRRELTLFDYRWRPRLDELGDLDEDARTLASFRYGGVLFHYYAESMSDRRQPLDKRAEHVVHAKRASIMISSALAPHGQLQLEEERLLRVLRRVEKDSAGAVTGLDVRVPTFLPYLLAKEPRSPQELLRIALRERRRGPVRSYREWRAGLLADLANGRTRPKTKREIALIRAEIERTARMHAVGSLHLSYSADWPALVAALTGNPLALLTGFSLDGDVDTRALRFRLASILPGRGFRRLITRLVASQAEYHALDRAVRNLWYAGTA